MRYLITVIISLACSSQAFAVLPFELPWTNHETRGETYRSSDHPNAVFVVEGYFLNCPYCTQNVPNVKRLAKDYEGEDRVQILDVGRDCRESDYARWRQRHNPSYPILNDCRLELLGALQVRGYPSTAVIDCHGNVRYRSLGVWNSKVQRELRIAINEALNEECTVE